MRVQSTEPQIDLAAFVLLRAAHTHAFSTSQRVYTHSIDMLQNFC